MTRDSENKPTDRFEIICRHKDSRPSNLNKLFATYGCQTLESRVPIVGRGVANQVKNELNSELQQYTTLAFKSGAASNAVDGRIPRTRNRKLDLLEIGKDKVIAVGEERDRSPVDRIELDDQLEEYMCKVAEARAKRAQLEGIKEQAREERKRAFMLPELSTLQLNEPNWYD